MEKIHETIKELESLLSEYEKINQIGKYTYRINNIVGQIEILEDIKNNTDIVVEGWKAALKEDKANN